MPLPVIGLTARVALLWHHDNGQTAANVIHVTGDPLSPTGIVDAVYNAMADNPNMWINVSPAADIEHIAVTPLDGVSATYIGDGSQSGAGTAGDMIPAASANLTFRTALGGRSHRGRIYPPFLPEANQDDGRISGDSLTLCGPAWLAFRDDLETAGYVLVVASYKLETVSEVTGIVQREAIATQRRRQQRVQRA